uniref:Uncharacterized protein n=1 Tax=Helianthus annuus TaxID=4232 RepID=A0A251SA11_HELAN
METFKPYFCFLLHSYPPKIILVVSYFASFQIQHLSVMKPLSPAISVLACVTLSQ